VWWGTITPPSSIVIQKGDTIQDFFSWMSFFDRLRTKRYLMTHTVDTKKIQTGTYIFSWSYAPANYIKAIIAGPTQEYIRYTILEGWSLYDIDADLTKKKLTPQGAFLQAAQSSATIAWLSKTYPFLQQDKPLTTLEWFLYPDTYFISTNTDPVQQLLQASLKRFREKIIPLWESEWDWFKEKAQWKWLSFSLLWAMNIASVIEKEERNLKEKPTIAGIFINRLSQDIQLGADITLCYGLKEPYETCTPSVIARWIYEQANLYNTRIHSWLPPTPISSITADTFGALMWFKSTTYLFYLHNMQWEIYYAETNAEHEQNKRLYMR
jgi:UPF0755 protein